MSEMVDHMASFMADEILLKHQILLDEHAKTLARAALKALRDPTEAMMAAVDCAGEKRDWTSGKMHLASWQAMIDEALK